MQNNISFNDGYKEFTINGDESRIVRFNPSDFAILNRAEDVIERFDGIENKLREIGDDADASLVLADINANIKEQLNYLFNSDVADILLAGQSPISMVDGEYLFIRILEAMLELINEAVEIEQKKTAEKMNKYIGKYK